jgi:hypothetical protein
LGQQKKQSCKFLLPLETTPFLLARLQLEWSYWQPAAEEDLEGETHLQLLCDAAVVVVVVVAIFQRSCQ